jgi:large subunit ribosomal protein L18
MSGIAFKRKREGRTNYARRLKLLVSRKPRAVVRKSLKSIQIQIVNYEPDGDKVLLSVHSRDLKKFGFKYNQSNLMTSYLTGLLCAKKAVKAGVEEVILDIGLQTPQKGGKIYAAVKGMHDGGLNIPCDEKVLPSEDRISGKHIENYAKQKEMTGYKKAGIDAKNLSKTFEQVKAKVLG